MPLLGASWSAMPGMLLLLLLLTLSAAVVLLELQRLLARRWR